MKTLCVSLLRLGDFFHHMHLLTAVEGESQCEIQILAFDEVKPAAKLFPQYKFHFIPRSELQYELVEKHRNWRRALHLLGTELRKVNAQKFDRILNMTHTSFAARCLDLLNAPEKKGLSFEDGRVRGWNPILKYVNDIWRNEESPLMNWVDVTALSLDLAEPPLLDADERPSAREIWLQPLTSDIRKNWDFANWQKLAAHLSQAGFEVRVIGAPNEEEVLRPVFGTAFTALTFLEMREQKQSCRILISGDTSVLHFAVLEKIPVHGIYLGPANAFKTPPRQKGAILWTEHSGFGPRDVAAAALAVIQGVDVASVEDVPFGRINSFGRLHIRTPARHEPASNGSTYVKTTGRVSTEGAGPSGSGRRVGQEDTRL